MFSKPFQTKPIAAFLLLFVCMNAGGAVCAAYCRSVLLSVKADHCPLAKQQRHCDKPAAAETDNTALAATRLDCCPMIVSFIPGTLEQKQNFSLMEAVTPASNIAATRFVAVTRYRFQNLPAYRGPPKNETVLHITNRTLRI